MIVLKSKNFKIGVFDSGLGGLFIFKNFIKKLPQYDYLYLGDVKRLPYGDRSNQAVYEFTKNAVDFLFRRNCGLVILACNTASAAALRKIQQEYLPHYPRRRILGVIVPTIEEVLTVRTKKIGVLATFAVVNSGVFKEELKKIYPRLKIYQEAAPLLVPLIENGNLKEAEIILAAHLRNLLKKKVGAIVLGCTHYPILKKAARRIAGRVKIISQDEFLSVKLADYLFRHPEIEKNLSRGRRRAFLVTDLTPHFQKTAKKWFGRKINLNLVDY
ncbi:MAG: glutamate racemase [Candidatus Niyogibacteria bacterium]|nr:glutamate racemase [Candidatus Niyogibacteria bacterium]